MKWAVGITTVPSRREDLLPRTIRSIRLAGFGIDRLFVDGAVSGESWEDEFNVEVSCRHPVIKTHGNWTLGLLELTIRKPDSDAFLMVQDDCVMVRGLREYLEAAPLPPSTYGNLFTYPDNQHVADDLHGGKRGWFPTNQLGKGAVALLFPRDVALHLVASRHMVERPASVARGSKAIDGGVLTALAKVGISEVCHNPSPVQHTGDIGTMGNNPHRPAPSFPGEGFNAMEWLT